MRTRVLLFLCLLAATAWAEDYGQKVTFKKGKALVFPDCELTYVGERKVSSPVFKPGFTFYDFTAASHGKTTDVVWSSGTGEIGQVSFEVGGKKFVLELRHSDAFKGWLKEDELVFWTQGKFDGRKKD